MTNPNDKVDTTAPTAFNSGYGLTKRELFALKAMEAVENANLSGEYDVLTPREVANRAVAMADYLIERLNSEKPLEKKEKEK